MKGQGILRKRIQGQEGMLTVEAVLAFVPFLLVILGIISFINIYMVHNRIQYALFQTASELSAYTYLYEATGLRSGDQQIGEDGEKATENVNSIIESLSNLESIVNNLGEGDLAEDYNNARQEVSNLTGAVSNIIHDPKSLIADIVYRGIGLGIDGLKGLLTEWLGSGLANIYIQTDELSAEEYLKGFGVVDGKLNYEGSSMFSDEEYRMIDIVVSYDIEIYFFKLFLKDPTVTMVQRCSVPAWLDGDGSSYE